MVPTTRLLPALAVTAVLLVGAAACGGDSDPGATPTAPASSSSSSTEAEDPLLAAVVSLQRISAELDGSFTTVDGHFKERELDGPEVEEAVAAYDTDRIAYLEAVETVGEESAGSGPEIEAAYAAFAPDARETVQHDDNILMFRAAAGTCSDAASLSPMDGRTHDAYAEACQLAVTPLRDSALPELRAFARGYDRMMRKRLDIYGAIALPATTPAPSDPSLDDVTAQVEDMNDTLDSMAAARTQMSRLSEDFRPTLDAVPDALDAQIDAVRLGETYPALLALVEARAGSSD